jgi:acyl-CoA dehydrogenase
MISFEPTEEQQMIRDTVAAFARDQLRPAARAVDEGGAIPAELPATAAQLGLVRAWLPEQYGGDGNPRSALTGAMIAEELAWGDLALAVHLSAPRLLAFPIAEMGTPTQRERYLKPLAGGSYVAGSAAIIEPRFDFDLDSIATQARRQGADWILEGDKCFAPLARESEHIMVYAGSGGADRPISGFIVARDTPGLEISGPEKNMGLKGLATYELKLAGCRVDAESRLGGEAGANFGRLASQMRVATVAMAAGLARAAFEYAREYARERRAFGVPIATKQAIAFMLADMAIEVDAIRLLAWEAAWHLDRGADALVESYLAKHYAAAAVLKVADNALQVLGGHGYIRDHPVELWLRNARGIASMEGLAIV